MTNVRSSDIGEIVRGVGAGRGWAGGPARRGRRGPENPRQADRSEPEDLASILGGLQSEGGSPTGDDQLAELRAQYAALANAMQAPQLSSFVNTKAFDVAESQAREAYQASKPVLADALEVLQGQLSEAGEEVTARGKQAQQQLAAQDKLTQADAAELVEMAAQDLAVQAGGNAISSLVNDNSFQAQAARQAAQANALSNRQLQQDMTRSEQSSISDREGTAAIVNRQASADAQNNLQNILNQIGIGRAETEAAGQLQFEQAQQAHQQGVAQLGFDQYQAELGLADAQQQRALEAQQMGLEQQQQDQESAMRQRAATANIAAGVQQMAAELTGEEGGLAQMQAAANAIIQQHATGWMNGDTEEGIAVDPMEVRRHVEAFLASLAGAQ